MNAIAETTNGKKPIAEMSPEEKKLKLRRRTWDAICKDPDFAKAAILLAANSKAIKIDDFGTVEDIEHLFQ